MGKLGGLLVLSVLVAVPAGAQTHAAPEHIHKAELKRKLFSKSSWLKVVVGAGWSQAFNSPHEWGRTGEGFAKRLGSAAGGRVVKGVVEYSVAASWTHEDLRY